ncbi:MAG: VCBS domain-containing protein, partial [Pseudomonadota bacterium]
MTEPLALSNRSIGLGGTILATLAIAELSANLAQAATLPDGYVSIDPTMGVKSAKVLSDGSLDLTLADGSVHHYAAGQFVVLEGGAVAVSAAVAEELAALADAGGAAGLGVEVAAGLLGGVAVMASGDSPAEGGGSAGNTPAVIGGDTTGSVTEDTAATLETSGTLTVSDADTGEAVFVAQASVAGANGYGTFTLGADG